MITVAIIKRIISECLFSLVTDTSVNGKIVSVSADTAGFAVIIGLDVIRGSRMTVGSGSGAVDSQGVAVGMGAAVSAGVKISANQGVSTIAGKDVSVSSGVTVAVGTEVTIGPGVPLRSSIRIAISPGVAVSSGVEVIVSPLVAVGDGFGTVLIRGAEVTISSSAPIIPTVFTRPAMTKTSAKKTSLRIKAFITVVLSGMKLSLRLRVNRMHLR
jgi:hypothetical protein